MISSDAPKLVYPLASTGMLIAVLQLPFSLALVADGQPLGILTTSLALAVTLQTIRALSTRVTEVGLSQLTWSGRIHLSWADITQMTRSRLSLTLAGENGRVVVPVEVFENTAAAIAYIESHVPAHISRNSGAGGP